MDPFTAFALGNFLILVTGAFVGFVHKTLPASVQPAAKTWRIANLVAAASIVIFAVGRFLPEALAVVLANALMLIALAGFIHALNQFYQRPSSYLLLLWPSCLVPLVLYWFTVHQPNFQFRVFLASCAGVYLFCLGVWTLIRDNQKAPTIASKILIVAMATTAAIFLLRAVVFGLSLVRSNSLLDGSHWANALSAIALVCAPVIFTVAFLLMCAERIASQWREAASTDYLTNLPNRRTFIEQVQKLLANSKLTVAIAILDIDHFKQINDRFGHDVGDIALKKLATVLNQTHRPGDVYARLGGEEFAIAFAVKNQAEAAQQLEYIRDQIARNGFDALGQSHFMTASFGVAFRDSAAIAMSSSSASDRTKHASTDVGAILKKADQALYQAKKAGRNCVVMADRELGLAGRILQQKNLDS